MSALQNASGSLRRYVTFAVTVAVITLSAGVVALLADPLRQHAMARPSPGGPAPLPVPARPLQIESGFTVDRYFFGEVQAGQRSELSFEFGGKLVDLRVDEGETVAEGDVIAHLDAALLETDLHRLEAERDALEADLDFAISRLVRQERLRDQGHAADEALDEARSLRDRRAAQIAEVDARIAATTLRIEKSVLKAPYTGRIAERHADLGMALGPGQPVVRLVDAEQAEIRVGLPLWVDARPGTVLEADIAGTGFDATLKSYLPEIDPVTRTRVALLIVDPTVPVLGAVARLRVPQHVTVEGAWIPREALIEGEGGLWSVLAIDHEDVVRRLPVEVVHAEPGKLFVVGALSEGLHVVGAGPHRLVPGQRVTPLAGAR
mgnify:CR=1 FL=1